MSHYQARITFDGPSDGGANYKVQITAYETAIYVTWPIGRDTETEAKREAMSIASHLVRLINESIP